MAYMNRGSEPSIDTDNDNSNDSNSIGIGDYVTSYVPLDNTYVRMQIVITYLIIIVSAITYIFTYKSTIADPIEEIKVVFINMHLIMIGILLVATIISNFFSKSEKIIIERLSVILAISILLMIFLLGFKLYMDKIYTQNSFEQFYQETDKENSNEKTVFDLDFSGVRMKTEKQYYLDECMKLYNIFKIKTYGILAIHLFLNIVIIYQIYRFKKIKNNKEKLNKDDVVIFDEEQNVKM